MQTELISLSKAFTENLFRIPDYQRGYSWGEKQLKEFWADLEQLEQGKSHYTGVLTLEDVPRGTYENWEDDLWIIQSKSFRPYFVVDGQQRLTTVIILVMAIIEKVGLEATLNYDSIDDIKKRFIFLSKDGGVSRSYVFGYEKDNPSYEFLKTSVFGEQSEKHSTSEGTIYTGNLQRAKEFFSEMISSLSFDEVERLYNKVTQHLVFNVFTISDGIDVHVTFETMNNRGKALSQLELLKNRLIYLSTRLEGVDAHDRTALRTLINESWKTVYYYLGKGRSLTDDFYLDIQAVCYLGEKYPRETVDREILHYSSDDPGDFLLNEVFSSRKLKKGEINRVTPTFLRAYSMDMKKVVEIFHSLFNPSLSDLSEPEKIWLSRIGRQKFDDVAVLIVAVYKQRSSTAARLNFLEAVENLLFFKVLSAYYFYDKLPRFNEIAVDVVSKKTSLLEVTELIEGVCKSFGESSEFQNAIKSIGKRGYYGWKAARYFLFEYEQHLMLRSKTAREKVSWEEFSKEIWGVDYVTLEHVYPQKVTVNEWRVGFNHLSVKQRNALKNSIGNLTPLSRRKNSSLGNRSFAQKKGGADSSTGFAYGCYSEIEIAQCDDWTPAKIVDRGVRLLEFMEGRWNAKLGSRADKIKLLGLEFLSGASTKGQGKTVKN